MLTNSAPRQPADIISHWYVLVEGVQFSAQEFYISLEAELAARKLPRLHTSRVEYNEGGIASDKRIYLRFARERFAFDVCAAPFGTGYFFSLRFVEKPRGSWLQLLAMLAGLWLLYAFVPRGGNGIWYVIGIVLVVWVIVRVALWAQSEALAHKASSGTQSGEMPDIDGFLLNLPGIGEWYERFRKDTYYRYDTRLLFQTLVTDIVRKKVDEVTSAKGAKLVHAYSYSPIIGELYKRTTVMAEL